MLQLLDNDLVSLPTISKYTPLRPLPCVGIIMNSKGGCSEAIKGVMIRNPYESANPLVSGVITALQTMYFNTKMRYSIGFNEIVMFFESTLNKNSENVS